LHPTLHTKVQSLQDAAGTATATRFKTGEDAGSLRVALPRPPPVA